MSATIIADGYGPYLITGVYREIVPDRMVVFTVRLTSNPEPYEKLVRFTLRPTAR